jgi:hypothetical protein
VETAAATLIPITVPEIRKLLWQLIWRHPMPVIFIISWSLWRRHHQAIARACHYERRNRTKRRIIRDELQL